MEKVFAIINNEEGGLTIVMALMVMVVLSIIGVSAMNSTRTELNITRNDAMYKENLYEAEGAAMEGARMLENATTNDQSVNAWISDYDETLNMKDPSNYAENSSLGTATFYTVQDRGVAPGSSLDISNNTNLYDFYVYGLSNANNGLCAVNLGYKKRF